jgi:hypothetical protein
MGLVEDYDSAIIKWNDLSIRMKEYDFPCCKGLKSKQEMRQILACFADLKVTQEARR